MKTLTKTLLTLSIGFTLTSNLLAEDKMYWVDQGADKIFKSDLDGSNTTEIVSGLSFASEIKKDLTNSKIYWTDLSTDKIHRANLDGSNVEDIVSGLSSPAGLALDEINSKIYWTDYTTKKIQRANFDGTGVEDLITGLSNPRGIDLDVTNSKMYWADTASEDIRRANFDGTGSETLVTGLNNARELFLDLDNSKIYWIDNGASKIQRSDLDGSNVEDVVTGLVNPKGLTIDKINSKLVWGLGTDDKIQRSNLDGSSIEDLISSGINSIKGITINSTIDAPLSVELSSFQARQIENTIQLTWITASETENKGFNVYRKTSDSDFIKIASYKSHNELLGQGNSTFETNYSFVDDSELRSGKTYTYYISDVETNGLETKHEENAQTIKFVIGSENVNTKKEYKLAQNFPNPFNPSTTISYQIAKDTKVNLKIYNIKGEFVKELTNGFQQEGSHSVVWNGTDESGKSVSSGTYFYKLQAGTFTQTNKMILLK